MYISRITRPLLTFIILLVILLPACNSGTMTPTPSSSASNQNQTKITVSPKVDNTTTSPEISSTSPTSQATLPATDSPTSASILKQPVLGYIDTNPAAFIQAKSGLSIEISDAIYNPETGGLESYKVTIKHLSGDSDFLEFHDIAFNSSTGKVDGYKASMNGNDLQGPTIEVFESHKSELGPVLAFSVNSFAGTEPLPVVSVPCQGDSNVEYGQSEGHRQVLRHLITCSDKTYTLQYSNYAYDNQLGTLAGYLVLIEIMP